MKNTKSSIMKMITKMCSLAIVVSMLFASCSEDETNFPDAASLRVIHAASDAPPVHVNYFGDDLPVLNFSINRALNFGQDSEFTIPANEARNLKFTYVTDTTTEVFSTPITLDAGQIVSFFLVGDSAELSSFTISESFQNPTDSVFGVNFVHASIELEESISIRIIVTDTTGVSDTTNLSSSLSFGETSGFSNYEATGRIDEYRFEYLNQSDSMLARLNLDPLRIRREKVFRNITVALIGAPDDGEGNSTLRIDQFDNF